MGDLPTCSLSSSVPGGWWFALIGALAKWRAHLAPARPRAQRLPISPVMTQGTPRAPASTADLFNALMVSRSWRDAARTHYLHRRVTTVPPTPDALLRAAARARSGDTLRLMPGIHLLSSELAIDRPLRMISDAEAAKTFARYGAADAIGTAACAFQQAAPSAPAAPADVACEDADEDATKPANARPSPGSEVVLVATLHVLLRTRCTALVCGLTLCRMGDEIGYPNAVTYAEAGSLRMERCRVTCGGQATSVPQALLAFADAPEPGAWLVERPDGSAASGSTMSRSAGRPPGTTGESSAAAVSAPAAAAATTAGTGSASADAGGGSGEAATGVPGSAGSASATALRLLALGVAPPPPVSVPAANEDRAQCQCPQSGVWVGAAASVELRGCTIACCMGPGIKIYRGRLLAQENTIAYSSRGANVVANGGHVTLEGNEISGATGDGISSWNNSIMRVVKNLIHSNTGAGIAVNTGGGSVTISNNFVFDNCQAVMFATSSKQATLRDNEFAGNERRSSTNDSSPFASPRSVAGASPPLPPLPSRTPTAPPLPPPTSRMATAPPTQAPATQAPASQVPPTQGGAGPSGPSSEPANELGELSEQSELSERSVPASRRRGERVSAASAITSAIEAARRAVRLGPDARAVDRTGARHRSSEK